MGCRREGEGRREERERKGGGVRVGREGRGGRETERETEGVKGGKR